ncbi:calcium/sodium antiporter [uncultured Eubacterium sp.]|uniref:calcium/sodium antiporter n=1 Tax=uncultured Eubacterium sp. TaxID=165185 RepID=UPI0025D0ECC0|nr:calcium/sodium antiporter [uncultured Eubacterium sp.]MCI6537836.1 calcium/sodium antiporter [Lachnospiraceae bacterium]
MILAFIGVVIGFVLLVKGADFFVDGSGSIAKKFNVPVFIIGMTIVAMGTSAPECAVSISASLHGSNGMAISNVIGSNIFNLLVVCGVCALFQPLVIKKATLKKEFPFSVLAAVILGIMGFVGMTVGHADGIILVVIFAFFLYWMVISAKRSMQAGEDIEAEEIKDLPMWKCLVFIGGGLVAIVVGGQIVVNCSETIARGFGLSETLIGLTICSIGTSLPELVTSVVAAKKNQAGMALGNVIGSNIFNILLVGGLASAISPITVNMNNIIDIILLIIISLYIMVLVWKKQLLTRTGGVSMLVIYAAYMVYICMREVL